MVEDIYKFIETNRNTYINWLKQFCEIPSVAAQNRGMDQSVAYLENLFIDAFQQKPEILRTKGFPVVFSHLKGHHDTTLSFYNHYDVQPEDPLELWNTPPFEPTIVDDKIFARGIADNKGNLIARVAAIHAIKEVTGKLPIDIKFIFEGEEEIGSPNLSDFATKYKEKIKADGCIWESGYRDPKHRVQVSLGVKGMLYIELFIKGANTDLHSANAAIVKSPIWRLIWAINLLKDTNEKVLIPGFYDDIIPPTDEEMEMIKHYHLEEESMRNHLEIDEFVKGLSGDALKMKQIFEPTCNICGIQSGYTGEGTKTVLPSEAFTKIDFRLVPGQDPSKIVKNLRKYLDDNGYSDIGIRTFGEEKAARTHPKEIVAEAVINVVETYTGVTPNIVPNSAGTGPMYELCQKHGVPAASFGVGHFVSNNHAPNENIRIEDFIDGIKMITAVVFKFEEKMRNRGSKKHDNFSNLHDLTS